MLEQQSTTIPQRKLMQPHWIGIMAAVGLLLLSVFGLFFVQKPLQETQEVRPSAAVNNGSVIISAVPNQSITVNQPASIKLDIDTKSLPTTGVQLVFNVHSTAGFQNMTAQVLTSSGLQSAYLELEQTADGALIGAIALPPNGQQFHTDTPTGFFELNFTPTSAGTLTLNFDSEKSIVTKYSNNPPEDVLNIIASATYSVSGPTVTPSPSPSPKVSPSPSPNPSSSCNKACSSNDNCPVNYRCYSLGSESRCRLVTNPTSTTCQSAPDGGLNRRCNEYCADSRECATGFSCWQNRCRNPENVDNSSCTALTQTQRTQSLSSCNQSCESNSDCATNLRCHSGRCRLASNPSSLSCSAATTQKVSDSYKEPNKGDNDGSATNSATVQATPKSTPLTVLPNENSGEVAEPQPSEETAQDTLLSMIMNAEYSLPLKVLIAGFILLIVGLIVGGFLSRRRRRFADQLAQPIESTPAEKTSTISPPPSPQLPPRPSFTGRAPETAPPISSYPKDVPAQKENAPQQSQSTMLDRIKEKGVQQPS